MSNKITITDTKNTVTITPTDGTNVDTSIVTTPVTVTQGTTSVVTINSPGPKGDTGRPGESPGLDGDIEVRNITASGNISASGNIYATSMSLGHVTNPLGQLHIADNGTEVGSNRFVVKIPDNSIQVGTKGSFFTDLKLTNNGGAELIDTGDTDKISFRVNLTRLETNKIRSGNGINNLTYSALDFESSLFGITTVDPAFSFKTYNNGGSLNRSRLEMYNGDSGAVILQPSHSSGNVGIGTNSTPGKKLTVSGSISSSNDVYAQNFILSTNPLNPGKLAGSENSDNKFFQLEDGGGRAKLGVYRGFRIWTNEGGPSQKLDIGLNSVKVLNADFSVGSHITASGNISASGDAYAANFISNPTLKKANFGEAFIKSGATPAHLHLGLGNSATAIISTRRNQLDLSVGSDSEGNSGTRAFKVNDTVVGGGAFITGNSSFMGTKALKMFLDNTTISNTYLGVTRPQQSNYFATNTHKLIGPSNRDYESADSASLGTALYFTSGAASYPGLLLSGSGDLHVLSGSIKLDGGITGTTKIKGDVSMGPQGDVGPVSGFTLSLRDTTPNMVFNDQTGTVGRGEIEFVGQAAASQSNFVFNATSGSHGEPATYQFQLQGEEVVRFTTSSVVLDYDKVPTADPGVKGAIYRDGSNQLFISPGS